MAVRGTSSSLALAAASASPSLGWSSEGGGFAAARVRGLRLALLPSEPDFTSLADPEGPAGATQDDLPLMEALIVSSLVFRKHTLGAGKPKKRRPAGDELHERRALFANLPCSVKACTKARSRVSGFCSAHLDGVKRYGHPTIRPLTASGRLRWIKVVRPLVQQVLSDPTSVAVIELQRWHASLRAAALGWHSRQPTEARRAVVARFIDCDLEHLLVALVCLAAHEDRRLPQHEDPRHYLAFSPNRLSRFYARQLGVWLRSTGGLCGLGGLRTSKAVGQVLDLVIAYRTPTTAIEVAAALHHRMRPRLTEGLAEATRAYHDQLKAQAEAARRASKPYGMNPDGSFDLMRAGAVLGEDACGAKETTRCPDTCPLASLKAPSRP